MTTLEYAIQLRDEGKRYKEIALIVNRSVPWCRKYLRKDRSKIQAKKQVSQMLKRKDCEEIQKVYLFINAFNYYKIGISYSPTLRRTQVASSSGIPTDILGVWEVANARETEKYLHKQYKKYRQVGEWFFFGAGKNNAEVIADVGRLVEIFSNALLMQE